MKNAIVKAGTLKKKLNKANSLNPELLKLNHPIKWPDAPIT